MRCRRFPKSKCRYGAGCRAGFSCRAASPGFRRQRQAGGITTRYLQGGIFETDGAGAITLTDVDGPAGDLAHFSGPPMTRVSRTTVRAPSSPRRAPRGPLAAGSRRGRSVHRRLPERRCLHRRCARSVVRGLGTPEVCESATGFARNGAKITLGSSPVTRTGRTQKFRATPRKKA